MVDSVSSCGRKSDQILQTAQIEAAGDHVAAVGFLVKIALRLVLVVNLADDLLHHVFQRDDAGGRAVLVHHHRHVRAFFLHFAQQIVDRLGFRNHADGPQNVAHLALGALVFIQLEHVADVHETGDGIDIAVEGGDARILLVDGQLAQFVERRILADGDDARPRRQHFAHGLIAEGHHGLDQLAIAFFDDAFFFAGADQRLDVLLGGASPRRARDGPARTAIAGIPRSRSAVARPEPGCEIPGPARAARGRWSCDTRSGESGARPAPSPGRSAGMRPPALPITASFATVIATIRQPRMPRPMCLTRENVSAPRSVSRPIRAPAFPGRTASAGSSRVRIRRLSRYRSWMQVTSVTRSATAAATNVSSSVMRVARSMSPAGSPSRLRQRASARAIAPRIGLVIHAGQVQQAVQHQDAQFVLDAVAQFGGLRRGAVERNRDIVRTETTARPWRSPCREILDSACAIPHPTQSDMSRLAPAESRAPDPCRNRRRSRLSTPAAMRCRNRTDVE